MRQLVIRESAFRACEKAHNGRHILYEIVREAFTGDRPDWGEDEFSDGLGFYTGPDVVAIYEALSPDIFASVREETTPRQIVEEVCSAMGEVLSNDESSRWGN